MYLQFITLRFASSLQTAPVYIYILYLTESQLKSEEYSAYPSGSRSTKAHMQSSSTKTRRVSSMSNSNLYCKLKDAEGRIKSVGLRVKNEVWGSGGEGHKFV